MATKKTANKDTSGIAIIETGGKQYKVSVGDSFRIEKIIGDHKVGDAITFDKVLLKDDGKNTEIGKPTISGAKVTATLTEMGRAQKVMVTKYKQKSRYLKTKGHRQPFFKVEIKTI